MWHATAKTCKKSDVYPSAKTFKRICRHSVYIPVRDFSLRFLNFAKAERKLISALAPGPTMKPKYLPCPNSMPMDAQENVEEDVGIAPQVEIEGGDVHLALAHMAFQQFLHL